MMDLYFAGISVPEPYSLTIRKMQEVFRDTFGAVHALNSPPHITLIPPFRASSDDFDWLINSFCDLLADVDRFPIQISDFGSFGEKVVYVNVCISNHLRDLYERLSEPFEARFPAIEIRSRAFHPHVTLASRDLPPGQFSSSMRWLGTMQLKASFTVESVTFYRHHLRHWEAVAGCFLRR